MTGIDSLTRRRFAGALVSVPLNLGYTFASQAKPRLPRKDCFFGLHFDLHPSRDDTVLGRDVTDEMVERFLGRVKPDFVQYDCKGHAGWLGYPSKVSSPSPGIVKDSLEIWRRVTAKHGVGLFIHFSGVWDSLAVEQHSEWARVRPDGTRDPNQTSLFGPYVDKRMIPQLKEVSAKYDLDGAWVDGECWATHPDYSDSAAKAFREATGIAELPKGPNDRGWLEFLEFNRERFRKYVRHYVDAVHAFRPNFQIASNWLYSTMVPERPELPVDFLSGDYLGNASISTARVEARYLEATDRPWDLMAWGFQSSGQSYHHKSAVQLEQEAAVVLARGGGFQIYYQPTRAGKLDDRHIEVMARVAAFCRARQALSHKTESVPQIGVVFSRNTLYTTANRLFGGWGAALNPARGFIDALAELHYPVDVVPDWKLTEVAARYPLIVLPDWSNIGLEVKDVLSRYARSGGRLLVAGAENAALFAGELGVKFLGEARQQDAYVPGSEVFGNVTGIWPDVDPAGSRSLADRYPTYDSSRDGKCAATVNKFGQGEIAAIYGPAGALFAGAHTPAIREFIGRIVAPMFTPMVELDAPATVELSLRRKNGKLLVHLGNCTAMQVSGEYAAIDFVPAVGPLLLSVRLPQSPKRVSFEPGGRALKGSWGNGVWRGTIERLEVHSIVVIES